MHADFSRVPSDDATACSRRKGDLPLRSDGSWRAVVWGAVEELVEGGCSEVSGGDEVKVWLTWRREMCGDR